MRSSNWLIVASCVLVGVYGLTLFGQETSKKAPAKFQAKFETTCGDFVIEVLVNGRINEASIRFYNMVNSGLAYDDCKFFRVVPNFMVQFGINGDPAVAAKWKETTIKDDPVVKSNKRGFVTFAKSGLPNSRTTQIFISFKDNSFLDSMGFSPFGNVVEGMDVVDKINSEYGEKPDQGSIQTRGNEYLKSKFPNLDGIKKATIVEK